MKYNVLGSAFSMNRIHCFSILAGLGITVAVFNFTAQAALASVGTAHAASELRSILKTYLPSQPWAPFASFAAINTQLGEECGGGTTQITGVGPVVKEVASCDACKKIAQCVGNKKGVSDPGYLWDSVTKLCGIGVVATQAEADSCKGPDTCLGVDTARFAAIKDDALAAVAAGPAFYDPKFVPDAETLLALTWVESKWNNFAGAGTYPTTLCAADKAPFENLCADQFRDEETKLMDVNGDGVPDGKACLEMPLSQDPDGTGPQCGGKIGIGQVLPSVYLDRIQSSSFASAGELHPNPWDVRDGFFAATELLAFNRKRIYDACFTTCLGAGNSSLTCQTNCTGTMDTCGIVDYHFGQGSCGITAEQQAFLDEVNTVKPVMKSLLDNGSCPAPPPPPGGGPIPTPCPDENAGEATLTNFISSTFNIHFNGPWSAGSLHDSCVKLYETSGTRFDDFFTSDTEGVSVNLAGSSSFCIVTGKTVNCGAGTGLGAARGPLITFNVFHELGHTLKALNSAASLEGEIPFTHAADVGRTIWPHGHISIYPYDVMHGVNGCGSTWETEEYADTLAYYLHPGLHQISPLCAGAPDSRVPYKDAPSPSHCLLMENAIGPYNPYCAVTTLLWQLHSTACDATDSGSCQGALMLSLFGRHAADAVQICRRESGGNPFALNDSCLNATSADYSVGLFQINLLPRCPAGITWTGDFNNPQCTIINQTELDKCKTDFGLGDPVRNASKAVPIASSGNNWCPWSTASPSNCALCPHP